MAMTVVDLWTDAALRAEVQAQFALRATDVVVY
jgi:hypothetical protein